MQRQDDGDGINTNSNSIDLPTSPDLAKLDMLIVQPDMVKATSNQEEINDNYGDDVAECENESNGVLDDIEDFDGIPRNGIDCGDKEDDIEFDDVNRLESDEDGGHVAAGGDPNYDNIGDESD